MPEHCTSVRTFIIVLALVLQMLLSVLGATKAGLCQSDYRRRMLPATAPSVSSDGLIALFEQWRPPNHGIIAIFWHGSNNARADRTG